MTPFPVRDPDEKHCSTCGAFTWRFRNAGGWAYCRKMGKWHSEIFPGKTPGKTVCDDWVQFYESGGTDGTPRT